MLIRKFLQPSLRTTVMESSSLSIASVIEDPAKPNSILAEPEFCYINVSGQIFKTRNKTLNLFPNTLLGSNAKTVYFNKDTGCYDFQRDRQSFDSILYYYQSKGVLRKPPNVSEEIFHKEVMFYGIKSHRIANGMMQTTNPKVKGLKRILSQKPAEYMHYKKLLRIQMIDLFVTVLFVIAVISEQIIQGAQNYEVKDERLKALVYNWKEKSIPLKIIMAIETLCTLWITTFLIMRFYWSENRCKFAKSFMATMDVFVVASYFVSLVLFELETYLEKQKKSSDQDADSNIDQNKIFTIYRIMACLRMIKLFRMVHVFNLARYNALFFSLGMAVKESISDLAVIFMFIFFCIVGYATAMFWITFKFTDDLEVKDGNYIGNLLCVVVDVESIVIHTFL